ncbi:MAG: hypothetical protein OXC40_04240, partial [Proteobacteria bacterium]|nr:hypothetical protein [Pseudomonadota bacterium]
PVTIDHVISLNGLSEYIAVFDDRQIYNHLKEQLFGVPTWQGLDIVLRETTNDTHSHMAEAVNLRSYIDDELSYHSLDLHIFLALILNLDQTNTAKMARIYELTPQQVTQRKVAIKNRVLSILSHNDDDTQNHYLVPPAPDLHGQSRPTGQSSGVDISRLYAPYSPAEMVLNIKKSKKLREFVILDLPYLTEFGYQEFAERVLTTTFEKHVFISYLLGKQKISHSDFMIQYNLESNAKFYHLTSLIKYKFFYFFYSGNIPSSEVFSNFTDEVQYFKSYYEERINNLLSDDGTVSEVQVDDRSQNKPHTLSWSSSVPPEISNLYASYSLADMVMHIKKSKKLREFFSVGLPYLTEVGYQEFEEKVLITAFEKHVFISYLLGIHNLSSSDFIKEYNLKNKVNFHRLNYLIRYKFFYFFYSGQLPSSQNLLAFNKEMNFFRSFYEGIIDKIE